MSTEPSKLSFGFAKPYGTRKFVRGRRPGERTPTPVQQYRPPTPVGRSDTGYESDATEYYGSDAEATNSPIRTFPTSTRESPNFVFESTHSPLNIFRISQNSAFKPSRAYLRSPRMSKRSSLNSPRMSNRASPRSANRTKRRRQSY